MNRSTTPPRRGALLSAIILAAALIAGAVPSLAAAPAAPGAQIPEYGPFEGPSAAGERLMMEMAGLLDPLPHGPRARGGLPGSEEGGDVQANDGADAGNNTTQSETALAVRGSTVCAGYNDSGAGGFSGLSRSTDNGTSWTDLGGIGQSGDPAIAVHQGDGTFYYAEIATIGGTPAIGVAISTDDCQTFAPAVDASPGASAIPTTTLNDKPWIDVDDTGGANDGALYVCWTRFDSASPSELRVSRSTDGGATWVNEQIITSGTSPFGCSIHVGPGGQVYLAWADRAAGPTQNDIMFSVSNDAGQNYSGPASAQSGNVHPGNDTMVTCPTGTNPMATRPTLTGNIRMLHQAWLAVDTTGGPNNGNLYLVWATDPAGTPDNSDVLFSRSMDGGANWSAPVFMGNGSAVDQFEPFVAVGGTGQLVVAWYDRRNDAANNTNIDVFAAVSQDGGATFDPDVRITDVSFGVPQLNPNFDPGVVNCYMGEYIAAAADASRFYFAWGDNRNTVTNATWPGGRPDPDVFFDVLAIPGANQPPTADAGGPYETPEGTSVTLDGGGSSDPDGDPLTYEWDLDDDGTFETPGVTVSFIRGDNGVFDVCLRVTDDDGESDTDCTTVTVTNVDPTVTIDPSQVMAIDEGGSVDVLATFSDPGWEDTYVPSLDAGHVDAVVDAGPTLTVTSEGGPGAPDEGTVEATIIYGDNGTFTVTVGVTDDDGGADSEAFDVDVANLDPTAEIILPVPSMVNGMETIVAQAGEDIDFSGRSQDPGSDDLTMTWDFDDGPPSPDAFELSLVNPPVPDPPGSPSVQPRDETLDVTHAFGQACTYLVTFDSTDDDGGSAEDQANVLITGTADRTRPDGWWHGQYSAAAKGSFKKDFDEQTLLCYLEIARYGSTLFDEDVPLSTFAEAATILKGGATASHHLERELLAAWLNFANGAVGYDQLVVDASGDHTPDTTFGAAVLMAEMVRMDPGATDADLRAQERLVHQINVPAS